MTPIWRHLAAAIAGRRPKTQRGGGNAPPSASPRYEPDESPPWQLTLGLGLQNALLAIAPAVLLPLVVVHQIGGSNADAEWMAFVSVLVLGVTTILMAVRIGPIGVGCNVFPGPAGPSIPFCILAIQSGGPGTLAALVIVSALFRIAISTRLSLLRRVVTPTVNGAIMILLVITVVPILFGLIKDVPQPNVASEFAGALADLVVSVGGEAEEAAIETVSASAGPVCALVAFAVMIVMLLRAPVAWRMWVPLIGVGAGCAVAAPFGIYEFDFLNGAPWVGFPVASAPGIGLNFGAGFWSLLPAFLFIAVVGTVQTNAMSYSSLRVSWREPRATDFRRVQGGALSNGIGNLLSGLAGGIPVDTGPRGSMLTLQSGCASRNVAICMGLVYIAVAFFPKMTALVGTIPAPAVGVFLLMIMAPLFVEGIRTVVHDQMDYRKSVLVGVAVVVGLGFQFELVSLPIGGLWESMLQKGLTAGGLTIVLLTALTEFTGQSRRRLQVQLDIRELPKINSFLRDFSSSRGWGEGMTDRLCAAAEETLIILAPQAEDGGGNGGRQLLVLAESDGASAELEFVSAPGGDENLEDRIMLLKKPVLEIPEMETMVDRDVSLRLLRHYASSVRHQQYYDTEIVTVRVASSARDAGGELPNGA